MQGQEFSIIGLDVSGVVQNMQLRKAERVLEKLKIPLHPRDCRGSYIMQHHPAMYDDYRDVTSGLHYEEDVSRIKPIDHVFESIARMKGYGLMLANVTSRDEKARDIYVGWLEHWYGSNPFNAVFALGHDTDKRQCCLDNNIVAFVDDERKKLPGVGIEYEMDIYGPRNDMRRSVVNGWRLRNGVWLSDIIAARVYGIGVADLESIAEGKVPSHNPRSDYCTLLSA